uniref:Uncharacterized protein Br-1 n=1 Tax=Babesia rodhaini TaxID=5870 RepID=Q86SA2_BABRO|nr:hypothetical protein-1 [Babesia rodhaini]
MELGLIKLLSVLSIIGLNIREVAGADTSGNVNNTNNNSLIKIRPKFNSIQTNPESYSLTLYTIDNKSRSSFVHTNTISQIKYTRSLLKFDNHTSIPDFVYRFIGIYTAKNGKPVLIRMNSAYQYVLFALNADTDKWSNYTPTSMKQFQVTDKNGTIYYHLDNIDEAHKLENIIFQEAMEVGKKIVPSTLTAIIKPSQYAVLEVLLSSANKMANDTETVKSSDINSEPSPAVKEQLHESKTNTNTPVNTNTNDEEEDVNDHDEEKLNSLFNDDQMIKNCLGSTSFEYIGVLAHQFNFYITELDNEKFINENQDYAKNKADELTAINAELEALLINISKEPSVNKWIDMLPQISDYFTKIKTLLNEINSKVQTVLEGDNIKTFQHNAMINKSDNITFLFNAFNKFIELFSLKYSDIKNDLNEFNKIKANIETLATKLRDEEDSSIWDTLYQDINEEATKASKIIKNTITNVINKKNVDKNTSIDKYIGNAHSLIENLTDISRSIITKLFALFLPIIIFMVM